MNTNNLIHAAGGNPTLECVAETGYGEEVREKSPGLLLRDSLRDSLALLRTWSARHRQRQELKLLSPAILKDIGASQADVQREADKWFWQT